MTERGCLAIQYDYRLNFPTFTAKIMRKTLWKLLSPPHFDDDEKNRIAVFLHITILAIIGISLASGVITLMRNNYLSTGALGVLLIPVLVAYRANQAGRTTLASYIVLFGATAGVTLILAVGQGIHDIAVINYGLLLIIASYLVRRKGIIIVTLALIVSAGVVVFGEFYGWLPVKNTPEKFAPELSDFALVAFFLTLGAVAILLLSQTLSNSLQQSRAAELRWRSLVNSIPDVVVILDREGIIQSLNRAPPQISAFYVGKSAFEVLAPGKAKFSQADLNEVLAGNALTGEAELLTNSGEIRWYSVSMGPIYQPDGAISSAMAVIRDIQNRKDVEAELRQSREMLRARTRQLETLQEISHKISALNDMQSTLRRVLEEIRDVLPLDGFVVALYDYETNLLSFPLIYDGWEIYQDAPKPLFPESVFAEAILTCKPHILNRTEEQLKSRLASNQEGMGTKKPSASILTAPMAVHNQVIGAISAHSYSSNAYTSENISVLSGVANQVAIAIENARLYTALQKELAERKRAEAEARELNIGLESRVRQRTAELEAVNSELASFTYTVSHDLRAPLRGIHGLAHIIIEEFEKDLPAESIAHIERIQANARQMGQLIDELLAFTHLGRQPLRKTSLDMAALTHAAIGEVMKNETRKIDFFIQPLPDAYGDITLIHQALTNMLSNAIKFTRKKENPQVEIGSLQQNSETAYFIRDNGAGFDMAYVGKLFGVFERLHRQDEFEGIGVGLAIVKRILEKHGGRVWAEGIVNEGATFFFTLPAKPTKREKHK